MTTASDKIRPDRDSIFELEEAMTRSNWSRYLCVAAFGCVGLLRAEGQTKPAVQKNADSVRYNIDNCVNEFDGKKSEKTEAGYQYWFVNKDLADGKTLKMSVVKPHSATHPPHSHPEDEFFFVLEGKVEFYLNGRTKVVGPFSSLYCPSNVEHGIRNVGDTEAKYLVVKKYDVTK
jgi:quercetin dioxygenase-like cupin family protein